MTPSDAAAKESQEPRPPVPPDARVSAAVCAFNAASDIADCLEALLAQDPPLDEILVVDNASTDGTAEIVRERFPGVRLIRLDENLGPCPARNAGLEAARNRLVFQIDQDVIVPPGAVRGLLFEFAAGDGIAVAFPRAMDAAHPGIVHYDGGSFHYAGVMALRHFFQPVEECSTAPEDVDAFVSLAALVDRDRLLEVGGYDPAFFILFEDHDLSYRLRLAGHRIRSVPSVEVEHRSGTEGISYRGGRRYPARRLFLHSRNRWLLVLKAYRIRTLAWTLPGVLLLGVAYVAFAWRQGALVDYVRAKGSLLRLLPHIRRERKRIAGFRRLRDRDLLGAPDLTFSPRIERGRAAPFFERALTRTLRAYWKVIARLCG